MDTAQPTEMPPSPRAQKTIAGPCRRRGTSRQIDQNLYDQYSSKIVSTKDREDQCKKCRIPRQARERRHDRSRICNAIDTVLQPVLRDVGIQPRIVHNGRKATYQEKPERKPCKACPYIETRDLRFAFRPSHPANDIGIPLAGKVHPERQPATNLPWRELTVYRLRPYD